ncbi:MAG: hypothetical protein JSR85_02175 [Proteobacteria bacterium]|nr:hypothetical protein [Pseudomonadota bacterium]
MLSDTALEYLSEALPVQGRALSLRVSFNRSLINSIRYLLDACVEVLPSHLYTKALQNLDSLRENLKLSGFLSVLHADFFEATDQSNVERVLKITEKLCSDRFQVQELTYVNFSSLNETKDCYYYSLLETLFSQEIIRDVKFFSLSHTDFNKVRDSIQNGLQLLKRSFPDFFEEFQDLVSEILILNAQALAQGSSSDLFGMIYKCYLHKWEKITDVFEFIIHEQSHLYVFSLNKDDKLVLNSREMHESPLRKEQRPLMGIYHAAFILARVCHVLHKSLALNIIPETERVYCQQLLVDYKKYYLESFKTIKDHAQMTPLGEALIHSANKLMQ